MLSDAKVATPATAATDAVPPSVPTPGLLPVASVTLPANPVATFPNASRAVTSTAGVMVAAAAVLVGCTVNTSRDAAAGVMLKVALVTPRSPSAEKLSVYPVPTLSIDKSENVASPPTAATVVLPERVPPPGSTVVVPLSVLPPGLLPSATVTLPVNVGTRLPAGSSALSWTAGLIAPPATVLVGCWVNASRVAAPGVIVKPLLVAFSPVAVAVSQ